MRSVRDDRGMAESWLDPRRANEWTRAWMEMMSTSASAAGLPAGARLGWDPIGVILDIARDRLVGRRLTLRAGPSDLSLALDSLSVDSADIARSVGQYGTVRIVAHDLEWRGVRADRLEITADNVHLRPGSSPTLVTAPVRWEAYLPAASVQGWLAEANPRFSVGFDAGGPFVGLARRARWARLEIDTVAEGRSIRIKARALRLGHRRVALRLPGYNLVLGSLPQDAVCTGVEPDGQGVTVRGLLTEWQRSVTRADFERLLASLRAGVLRFQL